MNTPHEVVNHWSAKILARREEIPQRVKDLDTVYKLIVEEGKVPGGTWRLVCRGAVSIIEGEGPADCTVSVGANDFVALARKEITPQVAFLMGKLKLSGNVASALKLSEFF